MMICAGLHTLISACVDYLQKNEDKAFLFATLTVKNCSGDDLAATCKLLYDSYIRLMDLKRMRFIHGAFRALEITHDNEEFITRDMYYGNTKRHIKSRRKYYEERGLKIGDKNPNFDMFHPHLHIIWVVDKSYFHHSSDWIDNRAPKLELVKLWQKALNVDYAPRADIRACKSKDIKENILGINTIDLSSAVAEVAKYAVKSADYLGGSDELNDRTVKALLSATRGRRMFEFYGIFRKVRQLLKLDDIENGDLVHVETEPASPLYLCTFISHGIKRNGNISISVSRKKFQRTARHRLSLCRLIGILHKWGEFREGTALTHGTFDKKYSVLHLSGVAVALLVVLSCL